MSTILRFIFYRGFIRAVILFVLGLNVRHRERLPQSGPAIIVANHNSHLDTMVLMTLLPGRLLPITRPVAAADYFLRNRWLAWFALKIVGIVPLKRKRENREDDLLAPVHSSLDKGEILIFFPEGSRGEPEHMSRFKSGITRLAEAHPDIPVIPVLLHGLGKALPRGEGLLVPFFCDVFIGNAMHWSGNKKEFMDGLEHTMQQLAGEGNFSAWE